VRYRLLFETCASPLNPELAPVTKRPVGLAYSRCPTRFGGLASVCARRLLFFRAARPSHTSDTPVAFGIIRGFSTPSSPDRQGRSHRPSVKIGQRSQPRMPSIDEGHSRACVNRCRSRVRSRDASATVRPSAPFYPPLPARRFRVRSRFRLARSPSLPIVTLRAFHAERRPALLWIRLPPIDFCNCNISSDAWARPRAPDSRESLQVPHVGGFSGARPRFRSRFIDYGLPLTKKFYESREPRQPFQRHPHGAASTPRDMTSEATVQPRRRLRATPKPNHHLRRWLLDDNAGLHGPKSLERRTLLLRSLLPQES
jgi:hypothetical protein